MMTQHKWLFTAHFRRQAYGWRSDTPIQRIKEAVTEIKQVARKQPEIAAEGAVKLLEKLSPALMQVDSSSGALGTAVNHAIEALVPIISKPDVSSALRQKWLERLWEALQEDAIPYIELLGDYWGEVCATPALASDWADVFLPAIELAWRPSASGHGYFKGTAACFSALYAAGRYEDLLALLDKAPYVWWFNRRWGVKALVALGKPAEALRYAEVSHGLNEPAGLIAAACEEILLASGLHDEAYQRYALAANQRGTYLATFRAIAKKYPDKLPQAILDDLIASTPGAEGKWFAAAKDAKLFEVAAKLIERSPTDPHTLIRAAQDFVVAKPDFAYHCALAALHWIALDYAYEITAAELLSVYSIAVKTAGSCGVEQWQLVERIRVMIAGQQPVQVFMKKILQRYLTT